jgi:diguanylate cyclase (GGDEF)-like protein
MSGLFSRNNRILGAIGGLALVAVAFIGLSYSLSEGERQDIQADSERASRLRGEVAELTDALDDQQVAVAVYAASQLPEALAAFAEGVEEEAAARAELRSDTDELSEVSGALTALAAESGEWRESFANPLIEAARTGDDEGVAALLESSVVESERLQGVVEPMIHALEDADEELHRRNAALSTTRLSATVAGVIVFVAASVLALWLIRRYGRVLAMDARQAGVLNRFTEVTSFAADDTAVAHSNLEALNILAEPDAAVVHIFNRSKDRAVPEASTGEAIAEVLPLNALSRCSGMVRGTMYVTDDLAAPLTVHCPIYPVTTGTLACVPLNSGEPVGAVHLYWAEPNALPLEIRASVGRIAEHAALSIGNRRLLAALQGQANTDPRTGLANSRSFDKAFEVALASRTTDESISVLMVDIDHFKDFNDRHGHPAGDEALRAFAGVLRSCMRDGDIAARYGGEEFAVLLTGVDADGAGVIAERIRARTESTLISLAPGITDRVTVSIGVADAPGQGLDRVTLLRIADEALYRAKQAGRNRVEGMRAVQPGSKAVQPGSKAAQPGSKAENGAAPRRARLKVER